jgi:hypothetical protein
MTNSPMPAGSRARASPRAPGGMASTSTARTAEAGGSGTSLVVMQPFDPQFGWGAYPSYGSQRGMPGGTYPSGFQSAGFQPGFQGCGFQPGWGTGFGWGYGIPTSGTSGYGMPWSWYGTMPAPMRTATDDQIKHMVEESLDADPAIPFDADINIDVRNGVVTLTGTVPNKRIKHDAGADAWWLPPVVDVENELQVSRARRGGQPQQGQQGTS